GASRRSSRLIKPVRLGSPCLFQTLSVTTRSHIAEPGSMMEPGQRSPGALVQCLGEVGRSATGRRSPDSGNVGLRARRLLRKQGIEIDELRIVGLGLA